MIETLSVPPRKSLATFGNLRQSSENVRKMFGDVRQAFGTSLENLRKVVGSLRKVVKNIVISMFI